MTSYETSYLKQGINLILEQAFTTDEIKSLELIAQKFGAQFFVYGLDADKTTLNKRIIERTQKLNKPEISNAAIMPMISFTSTGIRGKSAAPSAPASQSPGEKSKISICSSAMAIT